MTDWLLQASSVQAELENLRARMERLEIFYQEVKDLCLHHDTIESKDSNAYASVNPQKLGDALSKVDNEWYDVVKTGSKR